MSEHGNAIEVRGLNYSYPDGTRALAGVDLVVAHGERVALLGPNGAGKSTLILHLDAIVLPQAGTVRVDGIEASADTVRDIRSRVGIVFQDPDDQLFMTTVYDDVAFGPLNQGVAHELIDERVHDSLHAVGLAEVASKPGQHLSFGQRKRIALATVLSMDPHVLVLDEPTSNLDPRARRHMAELLASLGRTMIVATHDMDIAWRLCDRAVILDAGAVVADGPARGVLSDEPLLATHGLELPPQVAAARAAARIDA